MLAQITFGGVVSETTTLKTHDAIFPALSIAKQFTDETPRPNVLPEGGVHEDDAMPELSTAEKDHVPTAVAEFPLLGDSNNGDTVLNAGHTRVGDAVSTLLIEKEHVAETPALLVAMHPTYRRVRELNEMGVDALQD